MLNKYVNVFKNWDKDVDNEVIQKSLKDYKKEVIHDFLIDLLEECEMEVFYTKAAQNVKREDQYCDAQIVIDIIKTHLFR